MPQDTKGLKPINKRSFMKSIVSGLGNVAKDYYKDAYKPALKMTGRAVKKVAKKALTSKNTAADTAARKRFYKANKATIDRINRKKK